MPFLANGVLSLAKCLLFDERTDPEIDCGLEKWRVKLPVSNSGAFWHICVNGKRVTHMTSNPLICMVGGAGFEPATSTV